MIEVIVKNNVGRNKIKSIKSIVYFVPVVDGKEYNHIAESEDVAMLIGLGIKYDGINSQFVTMACRMLKIESEWAK